LPEGDGIYRMRTQGSNDLLYGSFGNLLRISITNLADFVDAFAGLTRQPEFLVEMRVDNDAYFVPAGGGLPSRSKYFLYPGGPAFIDEGPGATGSSLSVILDDSDLAGPAPNVAVLQVPGFDPEAEFPWDLDEDGVLDFQDPEPFDEAIPGPIVFPNPFEIGEAVNTFQLRVRNNRLDTFTWSVASQPDWITDIAVANGPGLLAPGEESILNITVSRAAFDDEVVVDDLVIQTDLFGQETVSLTLVVPPQS